MIKRSTARVLTMFVGIFMFLTLMMSMVSLQDTSVFAHESYGENATPHNETSHWWAANGCTVVPDSGATFDFGHACDHHDGCYGHNWSSRWTCDKWFLNDMYASCKAVNDTRIPLDTCWKQALAYWYGVRSIGYSSYEYGQDPPIARWFQ